MHRVCVLAYDGMTLLDIAGPIEVFHEAGGGHRHYAISLVGRTAGFVRTSSGVRLAVDEAAAAERYDTLIVPGADGPPPADAALVETVRRLSSQSGRVASICTGSFLLAEAGLLDGLTATTHWRYVDAFRRRYPNIAVEPDALFVRAGSVFTSAGVSAGIDLALALVEDDFGQELTRATARSLVVDMYRPGGRSQVSTRSKLPALRSSPLRSVLDEVNANPQGEHTLSSMARQAGLSTRQLSRLFQAKLGMSPTRFVAANRIETAQELLLAGASLTAAAEGSGFGSEETMRRTFLRHLGVTPTTYRNRAPSNRS